jgi:hypothetical protein
LFSSFWAAEVQSIPTLGRLGYSNTAFIPILAHPKKIPNGFYRFSVRLVLNT